jgi:hypothetical protein
MWFSSWPRGQVLRRLWPVGAKVHCHSAIDFDEKEAASQVTLAPSLAKCFGLVLFHDDFDNVSF